MSAWSGDCESARIVSCGDDNADEFVGHDCSLARSRSRRPQGQLSGSGDPTFAKSLGEDIDRGPILGAEPKR